MHTGREDVQRSHSTNLQRGGPMDGWNRLPVRMRRRGVLRHVHARREDLQWSNPTNLQRGGPMDEWDSLSVRVQQQ